MFELYAKKLLYEHIGSTSLQLIFPRILEHTHFVKISFQTKLGILKWALTSLLQGNITENIMSNNHLQDKSTCDNLVLQLLFLWLTVYHECRIPKILITAQMLKYTLKSSKVTIDKIINEWANNQIKLKKHTLFQKKKIHEPILALVENYLKRLGSLYYSILQFN